MSLSLCHQPVVWVLDSLWLQSFISCVVLCGLGAGRIGRSYSDRCLDILTGLLALKQEHITSGKTWPFTHTLLVRRLRQQTTVCCCRHNNSHSYSLSLCLSCQLWCKQCVTWSGCVLSVVSLCVLLLRAARRRCRIARSDPSCHTSTLTVISSYTGIMLKKNSLTFTNRIPK